MAFCKQCGADLNGANFCASCGTPADGNVVVQQAAPAMDPRQQTLVEMNRLKAHFGAKADVYNEHDKVAEEVKELTEYSAMGWIITAVISVVIGLFSKAWFFFVLPVPLIIAYVLKTKKNKERLALASEKLAKLSDELDQLYTSYGYCPIGKDYTWPTALTLLCGYVDEGRANTFSEAINCLTTDLRELERDKTLNAIAQNTQEAAKTAKDARNIAAASFIFKK